MKKPFYNVYYNVDSERFSYIDLFRHSLFYSPLCTSNVSEKLDSPIVIHTIITPPTSGVEYSNIYSIPATKQQDTEHAARDICSHFPPTHHAVYHDDGAL